jgi:hypothetical protein
VKQVVASFEGIFLAPGEEPDTTTNIIEHKIALRPGSTPIKVKNQVFPLSTQPIIQKQVDAWNACGTVQEISGINASWISRLLCTPKRVAPGEPAKWRVCLDARAINACTIKSPYPIPNMKHCIDKLHGGLLFSQFDLVQAFTQIKIQESDRHITAFTAPDNKLYQFVRMLFGLTTGPGTFSEAMNHTFRNLRDFVINFFDDVLAVTTDNHLPKQFNHNELEDIIFDIHINQVKKVFTVIQEAGWKIGIAKSLFASQSVKFCGFTIAKGVRKPDPDRPPLVLL